MKNRCKSEINFIQIILVNYYRIDCQFMFVSEFLQIPKQNFSYIDTALKKEQTKHGKT